jgi:TolB-like protein/class 3 adenylate cyclase
MDPLTDTTSAAVESEVEFDIAHVLCTDIVGYSKLLIDQQSDQLAKLNRLVRDTEAFRLAAQSGKLLCVPTGDGMVLVFFTHPQDPAECAVQLARGLRAYPEIKLRIGVHSGPVNRITDLNQRVNVAGAGINMAQRVMDCADAGHILFSKRVAEDLSQYSKWQPHLHELGEAEVKHGAKIDIFNFYTDEIGNRAMPSKIKSAALQSNVRRSVVASLGIAAVFALAAFVAYLFYARSTFIATAVPEKSIAIFPFKPLVAQSRDEFLENGMADTLISKLSAIHDLVIPALTSAQKYAEREPDPRGAGRLLRVKTVLDGRLQKLGDRLRVSARLLSVADGTAIWAQTFDEHFTDVFAVQDIIAQKVADALALHLNGEEQKRLTKHDTQNTEAYQLYLKGRFYWNKYTEEGFRKSIEFHNQALALDPNYALAYAGLADAYIQLADLSFTPPNEYYPKAKAYAAKALALDDNLAQSHVAMGTYLLFYEWKWAEAEKELKRGIQLNSNYADGYHFYNHFLESQGRLDEALDAIKRGLALDPLSLIINNEVGWCHYHAHHFGAAIEQGRKTLEMDPNFFITVQDCSQAYEAAGKPQQALELLQKALAPSGNWICLVSELGCAYADLGDKARALEIIEQLKQRSKTEFLDAFLVAQIYMHLDDRDNAFAWLDKAIAERSTEMVWIKVEPKCDRLHSDPRFAKILQRMNLPP